MPKIAEIPVKTEEKTSKGEFETLLAEKKINWADDLVELIEEREKEKEEVLLEEKEEDKN